MKRIVLAGVALLMCAWWWFHPRSPRPNSADLARSLRVVVDVAAYGGGGVRWYASEDLEAVAVWTYQNEPATVQVWSSGSQVTIRTATWYMAVNLVRIEDIVCERHFHHHPEPEHVELKISFRADPEDEEDEFYPRELFGVRFEQDSETDFIALCNRHRLRKDGDW